MKITILAFDLWGFNKYISERLEDLGYEVSFIDTSKIKYIYKNKWDRLSNFFSKNLLKKNRKKNYIINKTNELVNSLEKQDYCLIINPSFFKPELLNILRSKTNKFIAYNYDSIDRMPLPDNYDTLFDKFFSFDLKDTEENNFLEHLTNFIYLQPNIHPNPEYKASIIISQSKSREAILNKIANYFDHINIKNYQFIVYKPATKNLNKNIKIIRHHIPLDQVNKLMLNSEILIDLLRPNQTGLSFRIFEAMAMNKKIITNNKMIKNTTFYNPNNIFVIDENFTEISEGFLKKPYEKIPDFIYNKYTLNNWINTVFNTQIDN